MVEYFRVFRHVGFFRFRCCGIAATTKHELWPISKRRPTMLTTFAKILTPVFADYLYIGGGALTLVIVILVVLFLFRR